MSIKKIIIIIFVIFLELCLFSVYIPLLSPPLVMSFFRIENDDSSPHNVIVEIFNEKNESIFNKTYFTDANESIIFERNVSWNFPFPSNTITWSDEFYRFNITVDNTHSNEISTYLDQYATIHVDLFHKSPIRIAVVTT